MAIGAIIIGQVANGMAAKKGIIVKASTAR